MPTIQECDRCHSDLWDIGSWQTEDETYMFVQCRECGAQKHFRVTPQPGDVIQT